LVIIVISAIRAGADSPNTLASPPVKHDSILLPKVLQRQAHILRE
jgi:hypothetical protein